MLDKVLFVYNEGNKFRSLKKMNSINKHVDMEVDSALTEPPSQKVGLAHTLTAENSTQYFRPTGAIR